MKKALIMASVIAAVGALAQGTLLPNNVKGATIIKIYDVESGLSVGADYQAQIFAGLDEASLAAVGAPIQFLANGVFSGKTMTFDGTGGLPKFDPGATVFVRVDVMPVGYATYEDALGAAKKAGRSDVYQLKLGNEGSPPSLPAQLSSVLVSFPVVPEPSVLALIGLGAAALLLRRRN